MKIILTTLYILVPILSGLFITGCFEVSVAPVYTGSVSGVVSDITSESGISSVQVTAHPGSYITYTDSVGSFNLLAMRPGTYVLNFTTPTYHDTSCPPLSISNTTAITGFRVKMRKKDSVTVKKYLIASTATFDFSAGNISVFTLPELVPLTNIFNTSLGSDLFVKAQNNSLYILQRFGKDNVIKMKGETIFQKPAQIVYQTHIGNAVNIHDMVLINDTKAYISQFGQTSMVVFNPLSGLLLDTIGLSSFNPTGNLTPKMDRIQIYNNKAYVCLAKLTDQLFDTTKNSSVIVIDTQRDSVEKEIILAKKNPQGLCLYNTTLYIACTGTYNSLDGGIVSINLDNDSSKGVIVDETVLQGNVSDVIILSETKGYALVGGADTKNFCVTFNPQTKTVGDRLPFITDGSGFVFDGTYVYVSDRQVSQPGIIVINPVDDSKISGPFDTGLPPSTLTILTVQEY